MLGVSLSLNLTVGYASISEAETDTVSPPRPHLVGVDRGLCSLCIRSFSKVPKFPSDSQYYIKLAVSAGEGVWRVGTAGLPELLNYYWKIIRLFPFHSSYCKHVTTYEESNFSLSYQFILSIFSFLLRIKTSALHEEVSLLEKKLFEKKYNESKKSSRSKKVRRHWKAREGFALKGALRIMGPALVLCSRELCESIVDRHTLWHVSLYAL